MRLILQSIRSVNHFFTFFQSALYFNVVGILYSGSNGYLLYFSIVVNKYAFYNCIFSCRCLSVFLLSFFSPLSCHPSCSLLQAFFMSIFRVTCCNRFNRHRKHVSGKFYLYISRRLTCPA